MANDNEVKIDITIEEKAALRALTKLTKGVDKVEKEVEDSFDRMDGFVSSFAGNLVANLATAGFGAAVQGVKRLGGAFIDTIELAQQQEDAINNLNISLRNNGEFSESISMQMQEFASSLQEVTTVGDEVILGQLALARNFTKSNEQAKQLTKAALDLSAATGMSLESAVTNLGKTFAGLTGELGESVPALRELTAEQLKAGGAIDLVLTKFGGAATGQLNTFSGAVSQLRNTWGDFQEIIGQSVTQNPEILSAIRELNGVVKDLQSNVADAAPEIIQWFVDMSKSVNDFFFSNEADATFAERGIQGLRENISALQKQIESVNNAPGFIPDFMLADIDETNKKLDQYRQKLREVTASEQNLVEARNSDIFAGLDNQLSGRDEFVTGGVRSPDDSPRVQQEQAVNQKIIEQRQALQMKLEEMRLAQKAAEQERNITEQELKTEERQAEIEKLIEFERRKNDAALEQRLQANDSIEDAESKRLANDIARADQRAKLEKRITDINRQEEQKRDKIRQQEQQSAMLRVQGLQLATQMASQIAKEGTKEQQALAIASTLINTYAAGARAYKDYPAPVNFAVMATTIAAGLAQVAKIRSQSFATGGVVGGFTGATAGRDNTVANVRTGEMILNAQQQKNMFDMINKTPEPQQDNRPIVLNVDGREIARVVRDQKEQGFAV